MEDSLELSTSWTFGTRAFVIKNAPIFDGEESSTNVTASTMLIDAPLAPLLFRTLRTPPLGPADPSFFIADAGDKGAGMFASRDIRVRKIIGMR